VCAYRSIRIHMQADAMFTRRHSDNDEDGDVMHVTAYFGTDPQVIDGASDIDVDSITSDLLQQVEHWNGRGSGFVMERVIKFVVVITKFRSLHGSSYIPTPLHIANKHCVVNVKNDDNLCFVWAVLSCIYPPSNKDTQALYNYRKYKNTLNLDGLKFPLEIKSIPRFEKLNSNISVNVLSLETEGKGFCIEYLSKERGRQHHVNLLLLDEDEFPKMLINRQMTTASRLLTISSRHHRAVAITCG